MGYRVNANDITTNYTQTLAEFTANLKYEDIPEDVRERAKASCYADDRRGAGHQGNEAFQ